MVQHGIRWLDISDESMKKMKKNRGDLKPLIELFKLETNNKIIKQNLKTRKYAIRVEKFQRKILNIIGELDEYGKKNMKILDDCYAMHHVRYEIKYNSPVLEFLNVKLFHIVEAGFVDYVFRDLSNIPEINFMKNFFMKEHTVNNLFTLKKLSGCFILLVSGCILGILGLFVEFSTNQIKTRRKRIKLKKKTKLKLMQ